MAAQSHPVFDLPLESSTALWRYFKKHRYQELIESSCLWFSRADLLGDPFEGSVSTLTIERRKQNFQNAPSHQRGDHTTFVNLGIHESVGMRMQKLTHISCWHANPAESAAMWNLYTANREGIAIRTTLGKLVQLTPANAIAAKVRYANYVSDEIPSDDLIAPFVYKRSSFEHEKEVRIIIQEDANTQGDLDARKQGELACIPLTDLIDAVFVAPQSSDAFLHEVETITRRIGKPVTRSALDSPAIF